MDAARDKSVLRDDELVERYTDQDTAVFLANHGRLTAEEIPVMIEVLNRQLMQREPPLTIDTR